jgi:uncharacterized protein (TIGR00251 family)
MTHRKYHMHDGRKGAALAIRVTTKAKNNEVAEILSNGSVRIRLTAPPSEGKANAALIKFLADILEVPASNLEIVAGSTNRNKLITILDLDAETAQHRLERHLKQ